MRPQPFSKIRLVKLILFALAGALLPCVASFFKGVDWLEIAVRFGVLLIIDVLIVLFLEKERLDGRNPLGRGDNLNLFIVVFIIAIVVVSAYIFVPPFFKAPVFLSIVARCVGTDKSKLIIAVYSVCAFVLTAGSIYEASCGAILILSGLIICDFCDRKNKIIVCVLTAAFSFAVNSSFYFLQFRKLDSIILAIILVISICSGLMVVFLTPVSERFVKKQLGISLDALMDDGFSLKKSLREFSTKDYEHAVNVSMLAKNAALAVGVDARLAEVAAFYYRIGIIEGEPYMDNAVRLAEEHCFPEKVTDILYEYNGIAKKPSTVESAIVHICDCIVSKHELLGESTFQSDWNRDVIIMQTMNEKSQEGLYDESGLTMNMYIKVRDSITAEELLS